MARQTPTKGNGGGINGPTYTQMTSEGEGWLGAQLDETAAALPDNTLHACHACPALPTDTHSPNFTTLTTPQASREPKHPGTPHQHNTYYAPLMLVLQRGNSTSASTSADAHHQAAHTQRLEYMHIVPQVMGLPPRRMHELTSWNIVQNKL